MNLLIINILCVLKACSKVGQVHRLTWSSYCNRYLCVPFGAKLKHSEVEPLPRQHSCTGQCLLCCTPLTWSLFTCASAWLSMYVKTLFRCGPFRDRYFNYFELNQLPLYKAPYTALISIQTMPKETSSRGKIAFCVDCAGPPQP